MQCWNYTNICCLYITYIFVDCIWAKSCELYVLYSYNSIASVTVVKFVEKHIFEIRITALCRPVSTQTSGLLPFFSLRKIEKVLSTGCWNSHFLRAKTVYKTRLLSASLWLVGHHEATTAPSHSYRSTNPHWNIRIWNPSNTGLQPCNVRLQTSPKTLTTSVYYFYDDGNYLLLHRKNFLYYVLENNLSYNLYGLWSGCVFFLTPFLYILTMWLFQGPIRNQTNSSV